MANLRVFITGASGLLGGHLCVVAAQEAQVAGGYHTRKTLPEGTTALHVDLNDALALAATLDKMEPHLVIHAAVTQVEACERDPATAERVNVHASRLMAEWCRRRERRLVYVSSDLVFDGVKGGYKETDRARPLMFYGKTKLTAEHAVLEACPTACVARLPLMYGFPAAGGSNFFMSMLSRLQQGERVPVFHDQYRTPGLVKNMAQAIWELARSDFHGVIHVAGATRCSRYEMARLVCRSAGLDESLLQAVSMFDLPMPAPRPQDVSLDCTRAQGFLQTKLLGIEEGLQSILK